MLTKEQKKEQIALASQKIKDSKTILFTDFSGVANKDLEALKNDLRGQGAVVKVFKKRLLAIALKEAGIDYDPMTNQAQLAAIFSPDEISEIAGTVYKQGLALKKANDKTNLEVLGAYDGENSKVLSQEEFVVIAKLPSKDVLLAMVMGGISGPLRAFMSIVKQLSEKAPAEETKAEEAPAEPAPAEEKSEEKVEEAPAEEAKEEKTEAESDSGEENKEVES